MGQPCAGLAVILKSFPHPHPERSLGGLAWFGAGDEARALEIRAVRDHAATISFAVEGLTTADIPIGSVTKSIPAPIPHPATISA